MEPEMLSGPACEDNDTETVVLMLRRRFQVGDLDRIFRRVGASFPNRDHG
jgi:hypothetical protein